MNRSYSKIRHIQEANVRLEKRLLFEETQANAGEIQKFLQLNQDNTIVVDYNFGPKSAIAAGKYIFRGTNKKDYNGVTTVKRLWELMKADGLDVGTTPGFGPKMAAALAKLLDESKVKLDTWKASQKKPAKPISPVKDGTTVYQPYQNLYTVGKI